MIDRRHFIALAGAGMTGGSLAGRAMAQGAGVSARTCFSISFERFDGKALSLLEHAGKPILVVNTASLCGYTPQYTGLQKLWSEMAPRGLVMIAVPSNDFGGQEPGGEAEIMETAKSFGVGFPIVAKARVKGPDAHPFYRWAAAEKPRETPQWNFHKYLVGRDGHIAASIPTAVEPMDPRMLTAIEREFTSARS
jgi:glutathione peroxidase